MAIKKKTVKKPSLSTQLRNAKKEIKLLNLQLENKATQLQLADSKNYENGRELKDLRDNVSARAKENRRINSTLNRVHESIRSRFKSIMPDRSERTRNPFVPGSPEYENHMRYVKYEFKGMSEEAKLLKYLLDEVLERDNGCNSEMNNFHNFR